MTIFRFKSLFLVFGFGLTSLGSTLVLAEKAELKTGAFINGEELLVQCSAPKLPDTYSIAEQFCDAYIMGVVDLHMLSVIQTGKHANFCIKEDTIADDLSPWIRDWISNHPDKQNLPASFLVILALKDKLPCAKP